MSYNLNTNISKALIAATLFVTVIILCTVYNQLKTRPLLPATCNNSTYACLSLAHGLSVAVNITRNIRDSLSYKGEVDYKDKVIKMCQFPDPRDEKSTEFYAILATMQVLIPKSFHPKFKNPCWYSDFRIPLLKGKLEKFYNKSVPLYDLVKFKTENESKTLHCLPYFYIAGFPRSGTTALYSLISHHNQFIGPVHKEVHWLTHSKFDSTFPNNLKSVMRYIYHFDRAAEKIEQDTNLVTCDASASTLWDVSFLSLNQTSECQTPLLLSYVLPDAKYIIVLRNPVKRLYSEYWYDCRSDYRVKQVINNGPRMFHQLVEKSLDLFITCKSRYSLLHCLHLWQAGVEKGRCNSVKLHASLYYLHIMKWFSVIPRKQFFFIKSEDLFDSPHEILKKVFEFLNLPPISDQTTLDKFKPFNRKLANLLQDDKFLWDDV